MALHVNMTSGVGSSVTPPRVRGRCGPQVVALGSSWCASAKPNYPPRRHAQVAACGVKLSVRMRLVSLP